MSDRLWWPEDWADESMPPGMVSPDAFLIECAGPKWKVGYAVNERGVTPDELRVFALPIEVGDVVAFIWCEERGEAEVEFDGKGGFRLVEGHLPREPYNWCRIAYDQDTLAESIEELAATNEHFLEADRVGQPLTVQFAQWCDEPESYRLEATANGPRFIALATGRA